MNWKVDCGPGLLIQHQFLTTDMLFCKIGHNFPQTPLNIMKKSPEKSVGCCLEKDVQQAHIGGQVSTNLSSYNVYRLLVFLKSNSTQIIFTLQFCRIYFDPPVFSAVPHSARQYRTKFIFLAINTFSIIPTYYEGSIRRCMT